MIALTFFLFIAVFIATLFILFKTVDSQFKHEEPLEKLPSVSDVSEIHKDIYLEPHGCFSSLEEKFFATKIHHDKYDSGLILKNNEDIKRQVGKIINDGYDVFGYRMLNKYNNKYDNINIVELAILGKLSGYNYISVFSYDENRRGDVYLTYSPPMERQLEYQPNDPVFKQFISKSDVKLSLTKKEEPVCGYPCKGNSKGFMCGSVGFPDIKSPTRFAVYRIAER